MMKDAEIPKSARKFDLLLCDRDAVRRYWNSLIRPGLVRIKAKDKKSGHWEPEHVRQRLEAGFRGQILCDCYLIVANDASEPQGFIVTQCFNDEFLNVPLYLHLWLIWCEGAPFWRVMRDAEPRLIERVKELGLRGITGLTSRSQWLRRAGRHGYDVHQYFIRKDVV